MMPFKSMRYQFYIYFDIISSEFVYFYAEKTTKKTSLTGLVH